MRVVKSIVLIIGALILTAPLMGQENKRMRGDNNLRHMSQELDLSDEQKAKVKEIMKSSRKNFKEEQKASKEEMEARVIEILSPEQLTRFNELKAKKEEKNTKRKEAHAAIKEFRDKNIEPYTLAKRMELEEILSIEDKATLNQIRASMPSDIVEGERKRRGRQNKEHRMSKENRESLKAINKKYADDIEVLQDDIKSKQETWNKELRSIRDTYNLNGEEGIQGEREKAGRERKQRSGKKKGRKSGENENMKNARFLLMPVDK